MGSTTSAAEAAPWVGLIFTLTLFAQMTVRPVSILAAHDPLSRFFGWSELSLKTRAVLEAHQAGYIATNEHSIGATLAFYLRSITVFQTSERVRYEFMRPIDQGLLNRRTGIYLEVSPFGNLAQLQAHFDSVEYISTVWRSRNGDPIESYRIYELKGYRGGLPFRHCIYQRVRLRSSDIERHLYFPLGAFQRAKNGNFCSRGIVSRRLSRCRGAV